MSVYKRGKFYWYAFEFDGRRHQEPTKLTNRRAALRAQAKRQTELAERRLGLTHKSPPPKFE